MEEKVLISIEMIDWSVPCKDIWTMGKIKKTDIQNWLNNELKKMSELNEGVGGWGVYIDGNFKCHLSDYKFKEKDAIKALLS